MENLITTKIKPTTHNIEHTTNKMKQTTNAILMIRPVAFRMNEQTAVNNYYQKVLDGLLPETVNAKAQAEFDAFVAKLRKAGVQVIVVEDTLEPNTPDSIFKNDYKMLSIRQLNTSIDSLTKLKDSFSRRVQLEVNGQFHYRQLPDSNWKNLRFTNW